MDNGTVQGLLILSIDNIINGWNALLKFVTTQRDLLYSTFKIEFYIVEKIYICSMLYVSSEIFRYTY